MKSSVVTVDTPSSLGSTKEKKPYSLSKQMDGSRLTSPTKTNMEPEEKPFKDPLVEAFGEMMKGLNQGPEQVFEIQEAISKLKKIEAVQTSTASHNEAESIADFINAASAGNVAVMCRMWGFVSAVNRAFEKAINSQEILQLKEYREVLASHIAVMLGRKGEELLRKIIADDQYQDKLQSLANNYSPRSPDEIAELEAEKKKITDYLKEQEEDEE